MKMIQAFLIGFLSMKMVVAILDRPHFLADAFHESGEAKEQMETSRARIYFFSLAKSLIDRFAIFSRVVRGRSPFHRDSFRSMIGGVCHHCFVHSFQAATLLPGFSKRGSYAYA